MTPDQRDAWNVFKYIVENVIGHRRSHDFEVRVEYLMCSYHKIGARMYIKMHFLNSYLDYFPKNCGDYNEEQGKRIHQDLATIEERYPRYYNVNMLAVNCWCLNRDDVEINHRRRKLKRSFLLVYSFLIDLYYFV